MRLARVRASRRGRKPPEPDRGSGHLHMGLLVLLSLLWVILAGCSGSGGEQAQSTDTSSLERDVRSLGPRDGQDLPPTDLGRVSVGELAPDFSLVSLSGDTVTLSSFRGAKNVVLVFYRGHW